MLHWPDDDVWQGARRGCQGSFQVAVLDLSTADADADAADVVAAIELAS